MNHIHNYKVVGESPEAIVEICSECHHKLTTRKGIKGQIDNKKWLKEHVRDTAQPNGSTAKIFKRFYGKPTH